MFGVNKKNYIFIFCLIGCAVHLGYVVNHYLEFPVRSQVTIEFPEKMEIPDIDIHLPLFKVLDLNELFNRYPVEFKSICKKLGINKSEDVTEKDFRSKCLERFDRSEVRRYLIDILTVGDIEQLTVNSSSLISKVYLIQENKNISNGTIRPLCKIERHFSAMGLFLRIACRNGSQILSKKISTSSETNQWLVCIHYNMQYDFGFRFVSHDDIITRRYSKYQLIRNIPGKRQIVVTRFRRTRAYSLEWPYQTNCSNYHRSQALLDCLQSKLSNSTDSVIYSELVSPFGRYPSHYKFTVPTRKISKTRMLEKCFHLIETQQCYSVWYETISYAYIVKEDQPPAICLEPQIEYDVVFKTYPEITFSDLLIYISSILGIWFGISVYGKLAADIDWFKIPVSSAPLFEKRKISIVSINNEVATNKEIEITNPSKPSN